MIITEKVKLKVSASTLKHYRDLGYVIPQKNTEIEINVKDLTKYSRISVDVECDICKIIKNVSYCEYLRNISNGGFYTCNKCKNEKINKTMINRYGVESALQSIFFKEKAAITCFEKYGNRNYKNREKTNLTNFEKYGVKCCFQIEDIKNKIKQTNLDKYGVENVFQNEKIKEKVKQTNLDKYGVENPLQSIIIRQKIKDTCIKKYGVENPIQNQIIFTKQQISSYKKESYNGFFYNGTYELDFLMNYHDKIKIEKAKSVDYFFKNKKRKYYPDFYIPDINLIVEIKSKYTYNCNVEINEYKKMSCLNQGYNFLFIIDKNYVDFENLIKISYSQKDLIF